MSFPGSLQSSDNGTIKDFLSLIHISFCKSLVYTSEEKSYLFNAGQRRLSEDIFILFLLIQDYGGNICFGFSEAVSVILLLRSPNFTVSKKSTLNQRYNTVI